MASNRTPAPGKKRYRRSPEELIADLQKQIERVKRRAATQKAKQSPELKNVLAAIRSLDKALETASDKPLKEAITDARNTLTSYLQLEGVSIPKKRGPRKKTAA
jgi:hypothetical protein